MTEATADEGFRELCHDAKQSLATIMLLTSAGQAEVDDREQVLRRLNEIAGQTRWMASLLEDVLSAGDDDIGIVELSPLLERTVRFATAGFAGTVRLLTDGRAQAVVSPKRLGRALTNIVNNAVRAAGPGGCIQIRLVTGGRFVAIEIEDDGPGFGELPTVHGIGLAAARRAVASLGGNVLTGSSPLGGALVRVSLPAVSSGSASC
ncbi:MAG TPA: sensor histidine kinase [Nocardioidaceae bacterium]|nr:sensor histidine kinase [Nocardioidaceae bacterium]